MRIAFLALACSFARVRGLSKATPPNHTHHFPFPWRFWDVYCSIMASCSCWSHWYDTCDNNIEMVSTDTGLSVGERWGEGGGNPVSSISIPEVLFLGSDEIMALDDDNIEEVAWIMIIFCISVMLERTIHILMEVSYRLCYFWWVFVFFSQLFSCYQFGFTPGKWILGLRVVNCTSLQYTQTDPPRSVKVEPGNKLGLWQ